MKLELLDFSLDFFKEEDFSDVLLISVQHILESNKLMFEQFFKLGLNPKNTFLLGKCYSTNREVMDEFNSLGVYVDMNSISYKSHISFDDMFTKHVFNFLLYVKKKRDITKFKKIILLDDGGYLISSWSQIFDTFNNVVGVEQTSSGFNKLNCNIHKFPIINVARSKSKLDHESPFIADKIITNLNKKLSSLSLSYNNFLIIGGGHIGKEIYNKLIKDGKKGDIYDINKKSTSISKSNFDRDLKSYDLIIGATGSCLNIDSNNFDSEVILVSASSSDREFNASELRKQLPKNTNCFLDLEINNFYLLNSGFPLNFDGKRNSVSPYNIQLTRALIFSGVCLGVKNTYSNALIDLDDMVQEKIINKFKSII